MNNPGASNNYKKQNKKIKKKFPEFPISFWEKNGTNIFSIEKSLWKWDTPSLHKISTPKVSEQPNRPQSPPTDEQKPPISNPKTGGVMLPLSTTDGGIASLLVAHPVASAYHSYGSCIMLHRDAMVRKSSRFSCKKRIERKLKQWSKQTITSFCRKQTKRCGNEYCPTLKCLYACSDEPSKQHFAPTTTTKQA